MIKPFTVYNNENDGRKESVPQKSNVVYKCPFSQELINRNFAFEVIFLYFNTSILIDITGFSNNHLHS
jgi:hypothetical protein